MQKSYVQISIEKVEKKMNLKTQIKYQNYKKFDRISCVFQDSLYHIVAIYLCQIRT